LIYLQFDFIANDFTILHKDAYFDAIQQGKNIFERINDIKNPLNKIPENLLEHFDIKELMGPPELIPIAKEAFKRKTLNPLKTLPKLQFYDVSQLDVPRVNFTPHKSKKIEHKIEE
jgi:hypothetical protein